MMVNSPCQCPGTSDCICNLFFLVRDNDPHLLCMSCRGKECNVDNRCEDCHGWDDEIIYLSIYLGRFPQFGG